MQWIFDNLPLALLVVRDSVAKGWGIVTSDFEQKAIRLADKTFVGESRTGRYPRDPAPPRRQFFPSNSLAAALCRSVPNADTALPRRSGSSLRQPRVARARNINHTALQAGAKELRGAAIGKVDVIKHPAQIAVLLGLGQVGFQKIGINQRGKQHAGKEMQGKIPC